MLEIQDVRLLNFTGKEFLGILHSTRGLVFVSLVEIILLDKNFRQGYI